MQWVGVQPNRDQWSKLIHDRYSYCHRFGLVLPGRLNEGEFVLKRVTQEKRPILVDEYETKVKTT
jgi:hypothetical protein